LPTAEFRCKAAFNRPRDWIDIEAIFKVPRERIDVSYHLGRLSSFYTPEDPPLQRIDELVRSYSRPG
jgi:hypothetical protein